MLLKLRCWHNLNNIRYADDTMLIAGITGIPTEASEGKQEERTQIQEKQNV